MRLFGNYKIKNNELYLFDYKIQDLAKDFNTPLYIYDEELIRSQAQRFKKAFEGNIVTYASKALCTLDICRIIKEEGLSLDVVSSGELYTAKKSGFPMEKIYFHGNNKTYEEIELAINYNIGRFIVDNFYELNLIQEICLLKNKVAKVILRLAPGIEAHTHEYIKTGMIDSKFGFSMLEKEYLKAAKLANELSCIELKGIHCHIGSQIFEKQPFFDITEIMLKLMIEIENEIGSKIEELNLGGGFASYYTKEDKPLKIEEYTETLLTGINENAKKLNISKIPKLIIEPGRSIINNSGIMVYKVGAIKEIPGVRKYISVDGGMTENIRPALYGAKYEAVNVSNVVSKKELVTLAGKCCETGDLIIENLKISKLENNDFIAILSSGAYTFSMASNYNMLRRPALLMVKNNEVKESVKRQSYEDLLIGQK